MNLNFFVYCINQNAKRSNTPNLNREGMESTNTPQSKENAQIRLKKSDRVIMVNCLEARNYKNKVWTVTSEPFLNAQNKEVVSLNSYIGEFSTSKLSRIDD